MSSRVDSPHLELKPFVHTSPPLLDLQLEQTGWLYRYYDNFGRLLYIGKSEQGDCGRNRWLKHRKEEYDRWAPQVARIFVTPCYNEAPEIHESRAIEAENPYYNRASLPYREIDKPDNKPINLQEFMAVCRREGLNWVPGWWEHTPSQRMDDPWIEDDAEWEAWNPFLHWASDCVGFSFFREYSQQLYLSAMSLPTSEQISQNVLAIAA